jgi:hypothetical protein
MRLGGVDERAAAIAHAAQPARGIAPVVGHPHQSVESSTTVQNGIEGGDVCWHSKGCRRIMTEAVRGDNGLRFRDLNDDRRSASVGPELAPRPDGIRQVR